MTKFTSSSSLFKRIKVGNVQLEHRVVLAPMTRLRCDEDHVPTSLVAEYYKQRTTKGGLLIAEASLVSVRAGLIPGAPGMFAEKQIKGWRSVTDAVHSKGGFIYAQLNHLGRAVSSFQLPEGVKPISASAIAIQNVSNLSGEPHEVPHALEVHEIPQVIEDFVQAPKNAIKAGFDGVEIHAAYGYLIDQFINTSSNKRTDHYGGSIENRARLCLEIVGAVARSVGPERTAIRFSPWGEFQDMEDETPYETWGYLVSEIQKRHPNLAYIHMIDPREDFNRTTMNDTVNSLVPFREKWKGPFISAGGYSTKSHLAAEQADRTGGLIAMGRAFLANPDIVYRLKNDLPLNKYDRTTFYTTKTGPIGYTDYPFYEDVKG